MKKDSSSQMPLYWAWLFVSVVILVACSTYLATHTLLERLAQMERQAIYEEHTQQMQALLATEYRVIADALDSYRADAYDSGVDRIAEQQLLAAEHQLLLLQVIARQNAQMIELMMIAGP